MKKTLVVRLFVSVLASACIACCGQVSAQDESRRPNIILILADDQGYSGCLLTGVRSGKWKLILPREKAPDGLGWWGRMIDAVPETTLYDLEADPGETMNVASENQCRNRLHHAARGNILIGKSLDQIRRSGPNQMEELTAATWSARPFGN